MTTKEYITKYNLSATNQFNHNEFVEDMLMDFMTLLEVGKSPAKGLNIKGFENTVRCIRQKWDAVSNKTVNGGLPEKLWGYMYAAKIVKMKEELFPKEMEQRRLDREQQQKRREEWRRMEDEQWNFMYSSIFLSFFTRKPCPIDSFSKLGLESSASMDDVAKSYRTLSMQYHPDKGGSQEKFIEITEAKNKCIAYLNNNK